MPKTLFALALYNEWQAHPDHYEPIKRLLNNPFADVAGKELAWRRYRAWLEQQVDEAVFGEAFSLRQIYIPLRAYYVTTYDEWLTDQTDTSGEAVREILHQALDETIGASETAVREILRDTIRRLKPFGGRVF